MGTKYSQEEIEKILLTKGYRYIDGTYKNVKSKLHVIDEIGYHLIVCMDKVCNSNKKAIAFHSSNPYSIPNIGHYLSINNYPCYVYLNQQYIDSKTPLKFTCQCGNTFWASWATMKSKHKIRCDECTGYSGHLTYSDVVKRFEDCGLTLLCSEEEYKGVTLSPLICADKYGYKYMATFDRLKTNGGKFEKFHPNNPFTIENLNNYLRLYADGEYVCISTKYEGKRSLLKFQHIKCGRCFENSIANICRNRDLNNITNNKTGARCPHCDAKQLESMHALILKQVWLHEHPDTIVEDRSCINPSTHCALPTDIVNHRLKIAIEIQSWFHDKEHQKIKDEIKRNYWINRGYNFYAIDHRNYTVLEMIQLFFPNMIKIPDYIDYRYANKTDYSQVQIMLSQGYSIPYISKETHISLHKIYDAIYEGKVIRNSNYKNACFQPVVQMTENYIYINEFESIAEAGRQTGLNSSNIASVLHYGHHYSQGFLWYRKEDYEKEFLNQIVTDSPETAGHIQ